MNTVVTLLLAMQEINLSIVNSHYLDYGSHKAVSETSYLETRNNVPSGQKIIVIC